MKRRITVNEVKIVPIEDSETGTVFKGYSYEHESGYEIQLDISSTEELFGNIANTRGVVKMDSVDFYNNNQSQIPKSIVEKVTDLFDEIEKELNK